jgi:hypothetical protein
VHLLRTEWEPLEADFTRYYREDLRALCWGESRWGVRRLLAHIQHLPRDSATRRSLRGPEADWDQTAELLAGAIDVIRAQTVSLVRTWGGEMDDPIPLTRPGQEPAQPTTVSLSEWATTL